MTLLGWGTGQRVGRDLRNQRDDDVSRVNLISFSNAQAVRLMNLASYFSCTCIAPAFACSHIFFLFCILQCFFSLCARVCVCVLQELSGVASPFTFRRGLDEMRGPSVRHQGRPSEIVRPTCNLAEISP